MARKNKETKYLAMDFGTSKTIAYVSGLGVIFNGPSVLAYDNSKKKIIAVGEEALNMMDKTPPHISILEPLQNGAITDRGLAEAYLKRVFESVEIKDVWKDANVVISSASNISVLEKQAFEKMFINLGVKTIRIVPSALMAALGSGMKILEPKGHLLLELGAGLISCSIISNNNVLVNKVYKKAGNFFNEEIEKYIRAKYSLEIGRNTAEQIKKEFGGFAAKSNRKLKISGRSLLGGGPKNELIDSNEIKNIVVGLFRPVLNLLMEVLEQTPPELTGDILDEGITITGGSSAFQGLKEYLSNNFQITVNKFSNIKTSVIDGLIKYEEIYENDLLD
ncbi:rod shape-determining protein [Spiroplasma endosymbiont of Anurida maritima]|uniref:rod shape-determining protein n=1 Tax=Spiroplasma endosymbiont of Anurida maritima TaxID=2967972 RepID=UPI0036D43757